MARQSQKKVIGLTGPKGSGKGTIANYLAEHYGATVIAVSTILNEILTLIGVKRERVNQIALAQALRATFGKEAMGHAVDAALNRLPPTKQRLVVVDGVRPLADWDPWRNNKNATLVAVTASAEIRYQRIRKRGKTAEEKTLTLKRFRAEEKMPTETKTIGETSRHARFTIDTSDSKAAVYRQVDYVADKLNLKRKR
ncbi:hypothetical protein COV04_03530 [Candidatus Uhrbacteria bacterium CG10_big_fil_rev_8_21_14_0_10_48_11]|uniref:Dephospho-CoA kinase n=1 Tax=Candidatus Uhrbacteria bacterium CG10_big_fil_rev_8_21_14_0_10_48_11 TaxID=1975037 RepID=A0A2M8LDY7_9BACT|nr:MAG: hypothetical protein COV04_03530 [Candidatus Uhrbacteria bacterium CG10_big_fil_rev_8_21_14_0_10_48_11]